MKNLLSKIYRLLDGRFIGSGIGNYQPFKSLYPILVPFITKRAYETKVYTTANDIKMYLNPSNIVDHEIIKSGVWEPSITHLLLQYLQNGWTFLDVGANIGYDTLLGSKIVGQKGKVLAIEPTPKIYAQLQKNIALNNETLPNNITTFLLGAGSKKDRLKVHYDQYNPGATSLVESEINKKFATYEVEIVKLDDLLKDKTIDFIKMDIEGFEREAIQGMENTLKSAKYLIMEYSPNCKTYTDNILNHLKKFDFELFHIEPNNNKPISITNTKQYFEKVFKEGQSDIFAIKK